MSRIPPLAAFLLAEACALAVFAWAGGHAWLFPVAGIVMLLAGKWPWLGVAAALAGAAAWMVPVKPEYAAALPVGWAVVSLVLGAACAFLGIFGALGKVRPEPVFPMLGRMAVLLHFLAAAAFLASAWSPVPVPLALGWAACGFAILLAGDVCVKLLARLYTPRRHWDSLPAPGAFFFFRWMGAEGSACFPPSREGDDAFSLKLPEMWMWPALRRKLPWLAAAVLFTTWLAGALHEIGAGESGIRQTGGKWEKDILAPGIHFSLPWPLGTIYRVDTAKVHETVLGFRADPGQPILWERAHYEEEEMSLVGGGDDLLSISVPIHYRITDPAAYLKGAADGGNLVRDLGRRVMLELTIQRPAAEVMAWGREEIRRDFHGLLQAALDRSGCGIRIEEVCLRDVHPPVPVAPSYQEVTAAMEEKEAMLHEGESYRLDQEARAGGEFSRVLTSARSDATSRLARVEGDVARFGFRKSAWEKARALFEIREGFRLFDETLADTKKVIFDERIRSGVSTQLDLRKVLNPDLIDRGPAPAETLIPRPARSREAFDLDIEGFLRTGRGEAPAVSVTAEDPDNLLKANVPEK